MADAVTATPKLTDEQRRAIDERAASVALSAGAGCGKTFVLTERFLSHLQPATGKQPATRLTDLVAITFTDKAAREMRDRIRRKCYERIAAARTDDEATHWTNLLRDLEAARVSTIHSFCTSLLRRHAVEAGLDPHFVVLDEAKAATLLSELVDDALREQLAERRAETMELVLDYGLETLRGMVQVMLGHRHEIDFDAWRSLGPQAILARWQEAFETRVRPAVLQRFLDEPAVREVLRIITTQPLPDHAEMRRRCERLRELLPELPKLAAVQADLTSTLNELRDVAKVQGGGGAKVWSDASVYEQFKDAATALREAIDQVKGRLQFDAVASEAAAIAGLKLLTVARPVIEAYEERKRELGLLDFDDLVTRAHALLANPAHRKLLDRVAGGITLLMVDEFQDTDPLQARLIEALCGGDLTSGKLFFVGDYKQSIYCFRGADPEVFHRLREKMPKPGQLRLSQNFRSQPAILDFVNALFQDELGATYEPLVATRPQVGATPAIEFLWSPPKLKDGETKETVEVARKREADWIARRLRAIIESGEKIVYEAKAGSPPTARAVRPGDVAILLRALSDVQHYEAALREHGLDYYVVGGHAFYSQQEVFDVLNLLRSLESQADEVSLAGVLRSPMFSLTDETLFWLARPGTGLSAGLFASTPPRELDEPQKKRVQFAARTIAELRKLKDRVPLAGLLEAALERTGYDAVLLGEFLGQRKLANLRKLIDQARSFDNAGIFTLSDFIAQLSEFISRQPKEAPAATHAEDSNVVRLMSIHQAKGLEFPLVVVPDLERHTRGSFASAAFDSQLGPLVKPPEEAVGEGLYGLKLHQLTQGQLEDDEYRRLLYVATTRAADYLLLSSAVKDVAEPQGEWRAMLSRHFDLATGQCLTPPPIGTAPQVRVTTEPPAEGEKPSSPRGPDLEKLVAKARELAKQGQGLIPAAAGELKPNLAARRVFSFSRDMGNIVLKSDFDTEEASSDTVAKPSEVDALGLGTLMHDLLANCNFAKPGDVAAMVERHAPRHHTVTAHETAAAKEMLARFVGSARVRQLAAVKQMHRELEFLLAWPPSSTPDGRMVRGFIDCLYQDAAGAWHLLDYKTNEIAAAQTAREAAKYELQMLLYALAAEHVLREPPASVTLHFLHPGTEHSFSWDTAARQQAVEMVNHALAEAVERKETDSPRRHGGH